MVAKNKNKTCNAIKCLKEAYLLKNEYDKINLENTCYGEKLFNHVNEALFDFFRKNSTIAVRETKRLLNMLEETLNEIDVEKISRNLENLYLNSINTYQCKLSLETIEKLKHKANMKSIEFIDNELEGDNTSLSIEKFIDEINGLQNNEKRLKSSESYLKSLNKLFEKTFINDNAKSSFKNICFNLKDMILSTELVLGELTDDNSFFIKKKSVFEQKSSISNLVGLEDDEDVIDTVYLDEEEIDIRRLSKARKELKLCLLNKKMINRLTKTLINIYDIEDDVYNLIDIIENKKSNNLSKDDLKQALGQIYTILTGLEINGMKEKDSLVHNLNMLVAELINVLDCVNKVPDIIEFPLELVKYIDNIEKDNEKVKLRALNKLQIVSDDFKPVKTRGFSL